MLYLQLMLIGAGCLGLFIMGMAYFIISMNAENQALEDWSAMKLEEAELELAERAKYD